MPEIWKPILALILASVVSAAGTISLRMASDHHNPALVIVGASLWALSAAGFVFASGKGLDLSVLAASMSALGLVIVSLTGIWAFGDTAHPRTFAATALAIIAIALLAVPPFKP